jgi:para-aminobenzoate synthetase component 1
VARRRAAHDGRVTTRPPARALPFAAPEPAVRELAWRDPVELFAVVAGDRHAALLHSAMDDGRGRHSLIALEPFAVVVGRDGATEDGDGAPMEGSPFDVLREALGRHRARRVAGLPPLQGGAVGYLGYELGRHLERVPLAPARPGDPPEAVILMCDVVVCLDNRARRAWIVSSGLPEAAPAARRARARERLEHVARRLEGALPLGPPPVPDRAPEVVSDLPRPDYERAVRRVIEHILDGDVFQANLSQRLSARLPEPLGPFDLFRRLVAANPAPFSAYLRCDDVAVACSSPERFLLLEDGRVETRPIKGTRPRGATPADDERLAAELAASPKDRAENVMIVDLLRNDLSRVCRDGSVAVPQLCAVERFATVMHLVSAVTGRLRTGLGAVDLVEACFPGGSITGAPKIRAMEVIAELERGRRGPYCGAIGHAGWDGSLDTAVVIRTLSVVGRTVTLGAGGGVVADSDPAAEWEESMAKARPLIAAMSP